MIVELIEHTPNPERLIALSATNCHSSDPYLTEIDTEKIITTLLKLKHFSIFEHVTFTFMIKGLSRVATHQLVRHRLMSFAQQSHRYTGISQDSFICPPSIKDNKQAYSIYKEVIDSSYTGYGKLLSLGILKEDARFIIPQAVKSNIIITSNARELLHFFELRLSKRAQWEIRELAYKIFDIVKIIAPTVFSRVDN